MLAYLLSHQGSAKYLLAATGSQTTAPIIIETGKAVVTIGGFSGRDNSPTVAQLEEMVAKGELKYVLASGNGAIDTWVAGARHRGRRLRRPLPRYRGVTAALPGTRSCSPMNKIKILTISAALTATLLLPAMAEAKATWT